MQRLEELADDRKHREKSFEKLTTRGGGKKLSSEQRRNLPKRDSKVSGMAAIEVEAEAISEGEERVGEALWATFRNAIRTR